MKHTFTFISRIAVAVFCCCSMAAASQEEFLRALGGKSSGGAPDASAGAGVDPTKLLAFIGIAVGVLILVVCIAQARKVAANRSVNHPGKLAREITRKVGLRPAQLKKLKAMAEEADVSNPLVLLLCPSLMAQTMKKGKK